jgi:hypothetical protein
MREPDARLLRDVDEAKVEGVVCAAGTNSAGGAGAGTFAVISR